MGRVEDPGPIEKSFEDAAAVQTVPGTPIGVNLWWPKAIPLNTFFGLRGSETDEIETRAKGTTEVIPLTD